MDTAMHRVFALPELVEHVLLYVDWQKLFVLQRVSQRFRSTIKNSGHLQRKMRLAPDSAMTVKEGDPSLLHPWLRGSGLKFNHNAQASNWDCGTGATCSVDALVGSLLSFDSGTYHVECTLARFIDPWAVTHPTATLCESFDSYYANGSWRSMRVASTDSCIIQIKAYQHVKIYGSLRTLYQAKTSTVEGLTNWGDLMDDLMDFLRYPQNEWWTGHKWLQADWYASAEFAWIYCVRRHDTPTLQGESTEGESPMRSDGSIEYPEGGTRPVYAEAS